MLILELTALLVSKQGQRLKDVNKTKCYANSEEPLFGKGLQDAYDWFPKQWLHCGCVMCVLLKQTKIL